MRLLSCFILVCLTMFFSHQMMGDTSFCGEKANVLCYDMQTGNSMAHDLDSICDLFMKYGKHRVYIIKIYSIDTSDKVAFFFVSMRGDDAYEIRDNLVGVVEKNHQKKVCYFFVERPNTNKDYSILNGAIGVNGESVSYQQVIDYEMQYNEENKEEFICLDGDEYFVGCWDGGDLITVRKHMRYLK